VGVGSALVGFERTKVWRLKGHVDIGLAQPGLPGGAFGASLQGPGKGVVGRTGLTSYRIVRDHVCKYRLTGGTG
jgi:hypothetical protein